MSFPYCDVVECEAEICSSEGSQSISRLVDLFQVPAPVMEPRVRPAQYQRRPNSTCLSFHVAVLTGQAFDTNDAASTREAALPTLSKPSL